MSGGILGADRGLEWHRVVAPGVEVGETTTHGLALSRPRRGFESRWGHQKPLLHDSRDGSTLCATSGTSSMTGTCAAKLSPKGSFSTGSAVSLFGDSFRPLWVREFSWPFTKKFDVGAGPG